MLSGFGFELLPFAIGLKMKPKSIFRADVAFGTLLHLMLSALILVLALTQDLSMEMKIVLALTLGFSSKVVAAKGLTNTLGYSRVTTDCVLLAGWDASPARSLGSD